MTKTQTAKQSVSIRFIRLIRVAIYFTASAVPTLIRSYTFEKVISMKKIRG
jgi:hypothetical protein